MTNIDDLCYALLMNFYDRIWSPKCIIHTDTGVYIRLFLCSKSIEPNEAYLSRCILDHVRHLADNQQAIILYQNNNILQGCVLYCSGDNFYIYDNHHLELEKLVLCIPPNCTLVNQATHQQITSNYAPNTKKPISGVDFYVAPSLIVNAGLGLFSGKKFHRGERLMSFKGADRHVENAYAITGKTYDDKEIVFDPTESNCFNVDVAKKKNNFAPFINQPPPSLYVNAETVSVSNPHCPLRIDVISTRLIEPGDEIYMLYYLEDCPYPIGKECPLPKNFTLTVPIITDSIATDSIYIAIGVWKNDVRFQHLDPCFFIHDIAFDWEDHETIVPIENWQHNKRLYKLSKLLSKVIVFYNHNQQPTFDEIEILFQTKKWIQAIYIPLHSTLDIPIQSSLLEIKLQDPPFILNQSVNKYLCIQRGKTELFCLTYDKEQMMRDNSISDEDTYQWFQLQKWIPNTKSLSKPKTSSLFTTDFVYSL